MACDPYGRCLNPEADQAFPEAKSDTRLKEQQVASAAVKGGQVSLDDHSPENLSGYRRAHQFPHVRVLLGMGHCSFNFNRREAWLQIGILTAMSWWSSLNSGRYVVISNLSYIADRSHNGTSHSQRKIHLPSPRSLAAQWADFKEGGGTAALFHAAMTRTRLTLDVQLINQVN